MASHPTFSAGVCDVAVISVEPMERKINRYLSRWLGLPRSINSIALNRRDNILQLPFKSIMEEFKVSCTSETLQYRDSKDQKVSALKNTLPSNGVLLRSWKRQKRG